METSGQTGKIHRYEKKQGGRGVKRRVDIEETHKGEDEDFLMSIYFSK